MNIKRKLKKIFSTNQSFSLKIVIGPQLWGTLAVISLILFCITQLVTNAFLSPLGAKLASLNTEKNQLIELNRDAEKDIAEMKSLVVIKNLTEKKYSLAEGNTKNVIYVGDSTIRAEK